MKRLLYILLGTLVLSACDKQIDSIRPLTQIDQEGELATADGIVETTVGNYILMGSSGFDVYDEARMSIGEGRGNNVTLQTFGPVDKQSDAFSFRNSADPAQGMSADFFKGCYHVIGSTNVTLSGIEAMEEKGYAGLNEASKNAVIYAKGENLFLRALCYFNLARVYGSPYYLNAASGTCVPIKITTDINEKPPVATVKEVYAFLINDLKVAAQYMKVPVSKTNSFASTYAAWALLSRVYLYMGGTVASPEASFNELSVSYADSTLNQNGGKYALLQGSAYSSMFGDDELGALGKSTFVNNKEIIFAIDNSRGGSNMGELFHFDANYAVGATYLPSSDFKQMLSPADIRGTFFKVNTNSSFTETTKWLCLNEAWLTYAPEVFLRTGEVYLNRAEAYAKLGKYAEAKADLKLIHTRAGLEAADIDLLSNQEVLTAILKERRIELAFEGHAGFDNFRNGLSMTRIAADNNGSVRTINPGDASVVFPMPNR